MATTTLSEWGRRSLDLTKRVVPKSRRARLVHGYYALSSMASPLHPAPDFLVIGTKRGGTTSLFRYLAEHPAVIGPVPRAAQLKGVHYFDEHHGRGPAWYRSHFASTPYRTLLSAAVRQPVRVGEASPNYLFMPHAAGRAAREAPDVKVVVLLRDPVERAFSHYRDEVSRGREHLSFEEAVDREPERIEAEWARVRDDPAYFSSAVDAYSYLARGLYHDQLRRWTDAFGDAVLVLRSEDLFTQPDRVYRDVLQHLRLQHHDLPSYARHNDAPKAPLRDGLRARLEEYFSEDQAATAALLLDLHRPVLSTAPPPVRPSTPQRSL